MGMNCFVAALQLTNNGGDKYLGRIVTVEYNFCIGPQGSCCTDGMVLGPMPSTSFKFNILYEVFVGLNGFKLGDFDSSTNTMSFISLNSVCLP
jgi:hypothetical protein